MEPEPLLMDVCRRDGQVVVAVRGELDVDTTPQLQQLLEDLIQGQGNMRVALDLRDLTFIDSTGVRALVRAQGTLRQRRLRLIGPTPHTRRVLDICGLTPMFTISDDSSLSASA